jgi:hypothetical protein
MKYTGYSKAEIYDKIEQKRAKYGKARKVNEKVVALVNEDEIRRKRLVEKQRRYWEIYTKEIKKRWSIANSLTFGYDTQKLIQNMTIPIDNAEIP